LENRFQVACDDRILGEYEDVLAWPELHFRPERVRAVIAYIEITRQQIDAEPFPTEGFQDADDLPFAEVYALPIRKRRRPVTSVIFHLWPRKDLPFSPPHIFWTIFPKEMR